MPRDGQQGQIITPEQLSSALAFAGMTAGTNNSSSQSTNPTTADNAPSGFNGFREFLGSLLAAERPSSSPGILEKRILHIFIIIVLMKNFRAFKICNNPGYVQQCFNSSF